MTCLYRLLPFVFCLLLTIVHLPTAFAQSATATLSGTVEDEKGGVIPGASVTVENVATNLRRQTSTSSEGYFTVPLLPPSTYTVRVEGHGFAPAQINGVVLNVSDQKSLQIELKAGDVKAEVQVTTDAPLIDTSPAVGTVVDRRFVENIPLNGRSFQSLIALTPGVVVVPSGTTNTTGQFSVNGQRASANSFTVDGVSGNFGAAPGTFGQSQSGGNLPGLTTFGTTQSLVSVDALQEFKVQTSGYSAEYGRQPGGQISIVTRSGTNEFHGSIFDYIRNDLFDANDWFANANRQPKPPLRQNDFGGTFSGPVMLPRFGEGGRQPRYDGRNRTFFFLSYEGLRLRLPQFSLTNVPTLALREQALPGIQPILNAFPRPNGRDLSNGLAEFSASYSNPSSLDATSIRIDHTVNSKLTLFTRYNKAPSESVTRQLSNLSVLQSNRLSTQTITVGATSSLTPSAINELRVNYSGNGAYFEASTGSFGGATPPSRSALIPTQYDSRSAQGVVALIFPGVTSASSPFISITGNFVSSQRQFNIADNFSYGVNVHQFRFGVDYRRLTPVSAINSYSINANFFSQQQALSATAASGSVIASTTLKPVFLNFSAYVQDTWRPSRRLTLDLGVRWEVNPAPSETKGNNQAALTQIDNLATMQLAPLGTRPWKTTYNNFAPRLGVAYQVSQKPGRETVVRGGFGVFYDTGNDFGAGNFNQAFPYFSFRSLSNISYPLSPTQAAPAPLPIQTGLTPRYPSFFAFDPALKLPYTLQRNLAVEQSLGKSQTFTVSYVGAAGRRLLQATRLSLSAITTSFTNLNLTRNNATSDYDALQANFQRRLSRGLQTLVSYTWSHALDDDSSSNSQRVAQRGNAAFDVRHVFAAAVAYDIPSSSRSSVADALLNRWSIDTIIRAQSPLPLDLVASTLINPIDGSNISVRPNMTAGAPLYIDDPNVPGGRRINRAAFTIPPAGQSGNLGRNQLRGLPAWQVDLALRREFWLTERLRFQFRAEAFNLFNHPSFGTIQTTLTALNFGQATNMLNRQLGGISQLYQMGGPRSFQFALKLQF
ncbi:MAG TPA: TonB-dependent receptor [Pyrinomonadaceae bacterium]|nr:TonB-dependent receptor [Pyrinomonadaceae bacterium]